VTVAFVCDTNVLLLVGSIHLMKPKL